MEAGHDSVSDEVVSGASLLASLNYYGPMQPRAAWPCTCAGPVGLHTDHVWLLNFAPAQASLGLGYLSFTD